MSEAVVRLCDFDHGTCLRHASSYRVWRDGDRQAWSLDLCEEHAAPLLGLVEHADLVDLPTKPRVRMEATKLVTTPKTAALKKQPTKE